MSRKKGKEPSPRTCATRTTRERRLSGTGRVTSIRTITRERPSSRRTCPKVSRRSGTGNPRTEPLPGAPAGVFVEGCVNARGERVEPGLHAVETNNDAGCFRDEPGVDRIEAGVHATRELVSATRQ